MNESDRDISWEICERNMMRKRTRGVKRLARRKEDSNINRERMRENVPERKGNIERVERRDREKKLSRERTGKKD